VKPSSALKQLESRIAQASMSYPEVREDNPWDHRAFKVRGKMFVVLSADGSVLTLSLKLPDSGLMALNLPAVAPTGYGMGKSGWVTTTFKTGKELPFALILEWIEESFLAIAPKRVAAHLAAKRQTSEVTPHRPKTKQTAPRQAPVRSPPKRGSTPKPTARKSPAKRTAKPKPAVRKSPAKRNATKMARS
jgi:predicted DNA-binding protein (MmcQ/YjbR family)